MWIYFATSSAYADNYGCTYQDGNKAIIQAKVLIGKTIELVPDNNLKMPPLIDGETYKRYDSVNGMT